MAAYVIPKDIWYIVPEKRVRGQWSVGLHPELKKSKYGEYQEAWELLRGPSPVVFALIEAVTEKRVAARVRGRAAEVAFFG